MTIKEEVPPGLDLDDRTKKLIDAGVPVTIIYFDPEKPSKDFNRENIHLEKHQIEHIARTILPDILEAFEDPKVQEEFLEWQKTRPEEPKKKPKKRKRKY